MQEVARKVNIPCNYVQRRRQNILVRAQPALYAERDTRGYE